MVWNSHEISLGDRIKKNKMGGACIKYGGQEKCQQDLGGVEEK
jgi:hypothetical protein